MHPRMVMHPVRPELNGQDLLPTKTPTAWRCSWEFVRMVKTHDTRGPGWQVLERLPYVGMSCITLASPEVVVRIRQSDIPTQ